MRQKQRRQRQTKIENETTAYFSGGFELSAEPEQLSNNTITIKFINEKEAISYDKVWHVFVNKKFKNCFTLYIIYIV